MHTDAATSKPDDTAARLVDASELLMKLHGYHGFSYADVADRVGIRKASVHHHYKTKPDLVLATVDRYRARFRDSLDQILPLHDAPEDLARAFGGLFLGAYHAEGQMCLCAALTADWPSLPDPVRDAVRAYWDETREWLRTNLFAEYESPTCRQRERIANAVLSSLEGALLCARADDSDQPMHDAMETIGVIVRHRIAFPS